MVALDSTQPAIASWAVPVYGKATVKAGERIAGHFAIDLAGLTAAPLTAGQQGYLFMDDQVAGPQAVGVQSAR